MARILLIDDDVAIGTIAKRLLELNDHMVDTAENGAAALKLAGRKCYDLVITDVIMPEQEGIGVLAQLKEWYPHIRIILTTGGGANFSLSDLLKITRFMKAERGLAKPFNFEKLLETVKEVLEMEES